MPGAFILDDLSAVFNTADFATIAIVDGCNTVYGIFENETQDISTRDDRMVLVDEAMFLCPTTAPISVDSDILIDGIAYKAKTPRKDGTGVTTWLLKKAIES